MHRSLLMTLLLKASPLPRFEEGHTCHVMVTESAHNQEFGIKVGIDVLIFKHSEIGILQTFKHSMSIRISACTLNTWLSNPTIQESDYWNVNTDQVFQLLIHSNDSLPPRRTGVLSPCWSFILWVVFFVFFVYIICAFVGSFGARYGCTNPGALG